MYTLRFDGLFRALPGCQKMESKAGFLCYGWLIFRQDALVGRGHGAVARGRGATSNVAEYLALIEGLEALADLGVCDELVKICGDAKCVIDQMRGEACVNSQHMKPLHHRAVRLACRFPNLSWLWLPRRYNKDADSLSRRAMRQMRFDQSHYQAALRAIDPDHGEAACSSRFLPLIDLRVFSVSPLAAPSPAD